MAGSGVGMSIQGNVYLKQLLGSIICNNLLILSKHGRYYISGYV